MVDASMECPYSSFLKLEYVHCCVLSLCYLSMIASFSGTYANSTDPDQTPQNVASDQDLHCLSTKCFIKICIKKKKIPPTALKMKMDGSK